MNCFDIEIINTAKNCVVSIVSAIDRSRIEV